MTDGSTGLTWIASISDLEQLSNRELAQLLADQQDKVRVFRAESGAIFEKAARHLERLCGELEQELTVRLDGPTRGRPVDYRSYVRNYVRVLAGDQPERGASGMVEQ